ncbi:nuclear transport factor 2 family protein [Sphingobium sp.]|uniref:nuclear transport factor 2 family protein n=1 Tax=Sphingobium sp. TaxID=1912891 RepID=UPI0028BE6C6F|nr:nuclear transport factor 2 family protein [Sphingobium sp.]
MTDCSAEDSIRRLIESWVIWRDTGDFDRLAGAWHADGRMITTGGEASAAEFVSNARRAWDAGLDVVHTIGGLAIEIVGERAVAHSRLMISQRVSLDGIACDVECRGRFIDLLECRDGRWAIVLRHPAYDRDRIVACSGQVLPPLDPERLARFPTGYRHLAYVQSLMGMQVHDDLPGRTGPAMEALSAKARAWLDGD